MIPADVERLWSDYVAAERVRIRHESVEALERFIDALLPLRAETWHPWALQIARRVVDEHEDIPMRLPFFRAVIFPALLVGMQNSLAGSARLLAGFAQLIYKSPACHEQLPEELRSEFGLLLRAIRDAPNDTRAKARLLELMRWNFDYALHELPTGVLYGHNSATAEQCDELLKDLSEYECLAMELGLPEEDRELIATARFHIPMYRDYLLDRGRHANYEAFLSAFHRQS